MSTVILSAGRDPRILKNRNEALTAAGYSVVTAASSPETINRLFNGDFDVVLLCSSIPDDERKRLTRIVTSYSPSTPVIVISDMDTQTFDFGARTARCFPQQIIAAIQDVLARRPQISQLRQAS